MRIEFLLDYVQSYDSQIDNKKKIIEAIIHEEWEITDVNIRFSNSFVDLKSEKSYHMAQSLHQMCHEQRIPTFVRHV